MAETYGSILGVSDHAPKTTVIMQSVKSWRRLSAALASKRPSYTCPRCQAVSYHPKDIENRYCGRCHQFEEI